MPRRSPFQIVLSPAEKGDLERISRRYTARYYQVIRAKVVLLAAQGLDNKSGHRTTHAPPLPQPADGNSMTDHSSGPGIAEKPLSLAEADVVPNPITL